MQVRRLRTSLLLVELPTNTLWKLASGSLTGVCPARTAHPETTMKRRITILKTVTPYARSSITNQIEALFSPTDIHHPQTKLGEKALKNSYKCDHCESFVNYVPPFSSKQTEVTSYRNSASNPSVGCPACSYKDAVVRTKSR